MQILIVEDDAFLRQRLAYQLRENGYEVLEAENAEQAWQHILNEGVRLVIVDWILPGMSGIEFIRRVRTAELPHYIYIIMLTVRQAKEDIISGLEAGADDYITKPYHLHELKARISIGERILHLEENLLQSQTQLQELALRDALTGLFNRRAIYDRLQAELERTKRMTSSVGVILVDIDHFKQINDTYGHLVGDKALVHVAHILQRATRPYDSIGRWGGEEFVIIVPQCSLEHATLVAERLRQQVAASPLTLEDGTTIPIRLSGGVTVVEATEEGAPNLDRIFQAVDEALYAAKRNGRNRIYVAPSLEAPPQPV